MLRDDDTLTSTMFRTVLYCSTAAQTSVQQLSTHILKQMRLELLQRKRRSWQTLVIVRDVGSEELWIRDVQFSMHAQCDGNRMGDARRDESA